MEPEKADVTQPELNSAWKAPQAYDVVLGSADNRKVPKDAAVLGGFDKIKLISKKLEDVFPYQKLSVSLAPGTNTAPSGRSDSIRITWTDGVAIAAVAKILRKYEGIFLDILYDRHYSKDIYAEATRQVGNVLGFEVPEDIYVHRYLYWLDCQSQSQINIETIAEAHLDEVYKSEQLFIEDLAFKINCRWDKSSLNFLFEFCDKNEKRFFLANRKWAKKYLLEELYPCFDSCPIYSIVQSSLSWQRKKINLRINDKYSNIVV
ncbi:MAG: hypothetical protein WBG70_05595 [Spirulinaceae cyanobacterium]